MFVPGGFEEGTLTENHVNKLYLQNRKGFVKYALQYGYKLYPVFSFGENNLYRTYNRFEKYLLRLASKKIPAAIFYGRGFVFPNYTGKITVVIGKPLELPCIPKPSN